MSSRISGFYFHRADRLGFRRKSDCLMAQTDTSNVVWPVIYFRRAKHASDEDYAAALKALGLPPGTKEEAE